ncbi:Gfo/Idh/MocA family oxidoreductase [Nonomuraea sp. NPDC050310]|uniref:Gfo/Idh/MocA family protein n=1 Tax=Nonomuraea sp. NPDC050310 TaxID=3154935 RepID=UPI0033CB186B
MRPERTRYALSGLSARGMSVFARPLLGEYAGRGELVAVLDPDRERVRAFDERLAWYAPDDFERMVLETAPDVLLVAGPDHTHAGAILTGLRHGLRVVSEKPMVTTAADAGRVLAASAPGQVRVTHNLRYAPRHRLIRRLLDEGAIGRVLGVELVWNVESLHGASYFQRWNRRAALSGGLAVHKSCHHFDLVGWWLRDTPQQVYAAGSLAYFGAASPHNPGAALPVAEQRRRCPFNARWREEGVELPALRGRQYGGQERYLYDAEIDIEDNYAALVRYRGGAHLSYSIQFAAPWEGYRLGVNGTHGRLETSLEYGRQAAGPQPPVVVHPMFGERRAYEVPGEHGGHLGADGPMVADLFGDGPGDLAPAADAARAVVLGEAVRRSIRTGQAVDVDALLAVAGGADPAGPLG